jgi:hypothetical protein
MKKVLLSICTLLVLITASFAAAPSSPTPNNASLNGVYSFQLANTQVEFYSAQWQCPTYTTTTTSVDPITGIVTTVTTQHDPYTASNGGTAGKQEITTGTVTFDGKGGVTGTATQYSKFNYAASVAAVPQTCPVSGGSNAVYDPPSTLSFTGTYSIQSDGTGAMLLTIAGQTDQPSMILRVAGASTKGLRSTVYMFGYRTSDKSADVSGSATLQ